MCSYGLKMHVKLFTRTIYVIYLTLLQCFNMYIEMYWLAGLSFLAISSAAFSCLFEGQFKDVNIPFTLFVVLHCVLGEIHLTMACTLQLIQLYFSSST